MAEGLRMFLESNRVRNQTVKFAVSKQFVQEDGSPAEWEARALSKEEEEGLRRRFTRAVQIPGKPNQFRQEFDENGYMAGLAAACTVFPNLNDKELQDSYGAMGAENLLKVMLLPGEFYRYISFLQDLNGFSSLNELEDEAKN